MTSKNIKGSRRYLPFVIIAAVLGVALIAGALMFRRSSSDQTRRATLSQPLSGSAAPPAAAPRTTTPPQPGAQPPHIRGDANAPVTLEEFGDFQCPPCGTLYSEMKKIKADYGPRLRVIFRHVPLAQIHKHAVAAALAAEAAALQGRFWEMHDLLYENQKTWDAATDAQALFVGYARDLGLDVERFKKDMSMQGVASERVNADLRRAKSLGVQGTPTVFINGQEVTSITPIDLRARIDAVLRSGAQQ